MAFRSGRPIQLPAPPDELDAGLIRLMCRRQPSVVSGQEIAAGQVLDSISEDDQELACVSPISGKVSQLDAIDGGFDAGPGTGGYEITIEPTEDRVATSLPIEPPRRCALDDWLQAVASLGGLASRRGPLGLHTQLVAAKSTPPDTLICVGLDTFPPYPVRSNLLMSFPDDAVLGTLVLADLVGATNVTMLASRHAQVLSQIKPSCKNFRLKLTACDDVYPNADPALVVPRHTHDHRLLRVGANPVSNAGVMLINPWTAIRIARWQTLGRFDVAKPMMIGWAKRGAAMTVSYALPGQSLASLDSQLDLALQQGDRVILGNPMANQPVCNVTDKPTYNHNPTVPDNELLVTVLDATPAPLVEPCISCGWCVEACPTGLRPNRMMDLATVKRLSKRGGAFLDKQLQWCIDCGLCSHVCPTSLPLAQTFRRVTAERQPI